MARSGESLVVQRPRGQGKYSIQSKQQVCASLPVLCLLGPASRNAKSQYVGGRCKLAANPRRGREQVLEPGGDA